MRTNLKSYNKLKSKSKACFSRDLEDKALGRYIEDAENSENFEVGDYPHLNLSRYAGFSVPRKIYDSSHLDLDRDEPLEDDKLLYMSKVAISFYNMNKGEDYINVKVLMATGHGLGDYSYYITFQAFRNPSKKGSAVPVTFQTKILSSYLQPHPKFEIIFVRLKPHHKRRRTSEFDDNADITQDHLSRFLDPKLVSSNSLAFYLSQYALASYNLNVLSEDVAKHDIESLRVLNLNKLLAKVPSYLITFSAPLLAKTAVTGVECVETFQIEVCMPSLFPTTTIEFKSEAQVITPVHL